MPDDGREGDYPNQPQPAGSAASVYTGTRAGSLILGVPTVVGESFEDMLRSDSDEGARVNDLASELLLPMDKVKAFFPPLPLSPAS